MDALQHRELQELLARLADGDRAAFPPAFTLLWPVTRSFARAFLGDAAGAEDAAQQALVRLFLRASEFDATRDALPWVLGIVANDCRTLRRRAQRRREGPLESAGARAGPPHPGPGARRPPRARGGVDGKLVPASGPRAGLRGRARRADRRLSLAGPGVEAGGRARPGRRPRASLAAAADAGGGRG